MRHEADQRHSGIIVCTVGLGESKVRAKVPGQKVSEQEADDEKLPAREIKLYRALVARANYLIQDRSGIQFSVKELARDMSSPTQKSMRGLTKKGRYFKTHSRSRHLYQRQDCPEELTIGTGTDYAGCKKSRKSTSGGAVAR